MVRGETFNLQAFESAAFRHFINVFTNKQSGVTSGCEVTQDSQNISVAKGYFFIQGGLLKETTGTANSIPTDAGYYKLVYEIDLSKTNTKHDFNQGSYKFVKALGEYPSLIQENLDNGGTIYQLPFCQFRITEQGIQDFKDIRTIINYGIYQEKGNTLWQNPDLQSQFNAQTLKIENLEKYNEIKVYFFRNYSQDQKNIMTVNVPKNYTKEINYSDYHENNTRAWLRSVSFSSNGIVFGNALINNSVTNFALVPYLIVGYK